MSSRISSLLLHRRVVPSLLPQKEDSPTLTLSPEASPGTICESAEWLGQTHATGWANRHCGQSQESAPTLTAAVVILVVYTWPFRRPRRQEGLQDSAVTALTWVYRLLAAMGSSSSALAPVCPNKSPA